MQRAELQAQKPWGLMQQGVGCPSRVPRARETKASWDYTPGDFPFCGDSG